jgi:hypothetical protein
VVRSALDTQHVRVSLTLTVRFVGAPPVVDSLKGMSAAMKRLSDAYVQYRGRIDAKPAELEEAAVALDAEIGSVKAEAESWV